MNSRLLAKSSHEPNAAAATVKKVLPVALLSDGRCVAAEPK
ncbi:hypothetical protein [Casimicrobium huifangae]|nr:hypothetical protein [Casimicrobium huifangae]